jgi:hypothetical protein
MLTSRGIDFAFGCFFYYFYIYLFSFSLLQVLCCKPTSGSTTDTLYFRACSVIRLSQLAVFFPLQELFQLVITSSDGWFFVSAHELHFTSSLNFSPLSTPLTARRSRRSICLHSRILAAAVSRMHGPPGSHGVASKSFVLTLTLHTRSLHWHLIWTELSSSSIDRT